MGSRRRPAPARLAIPDYALLADFRYHIRQFLRAREDSARAAGLEPQQYLLLLQVKGLEGRAAPTIGTVAERLQIRHHSAVELVNRLEARGLVRRRAAGQGRAVMVELSPAAERVLERLALASLNELRTAGPTLVTELRRLIEDTKPAAPTGRRPRRGAST